MQRAEKEKLAARVRKILDERDGLNIGQKEDIIVRIDAELELACEDEPIPSHLPSDGIEGAIRPKDGLHSDLR